MAFVRLAMMQKATMQTEEKAKLYWRTKRRAKQLWARVEETSYEQWPKPKAGIMTFA